jgi:hypothetical protein
MQTQTRRALGLILAFSAAACSSSSSGSVDAGGFGVGDSGATDSGKHDSGGGTNHKDAGATKDAAVKLPGDASCGSKAGSDWCQTNAPMLTDTSSVLCDDFDIGTPSNIFNYTGLERSSFVDTHFQSPYCALRTFVGDGGGYASAGDAGLNPVGSFTEHPYPLATGSGAATLAFDLFVPDAAACEGAVVGRLYVTDTAGVRSDALTAWVSISGLGAGTAGASNYAMNIGAQVAAGTSATSTKPVMVTPRAADKGWARISLDISAYSMAANPASIAGTVAWLYPGAKTAAATSSAVSASGSVMMPAGEGEMFFDVGVVGDPASGTAPAGCELFVDNFVSNITN